VRQVAKELGFSEATVRKRFKNGSGAHTLGRFKKTFNDIQEREIVDHCKILNKMYYGLSFRSLRFLIRRYAEENHIKHFFPKDNAMAGKDFTMNFMRRHGLSLRTARKTSVARTMGFNKHQLGVYFENLKEVIEKYGFLASEIYNMDETGVQTVPSKIPKIVSDVKQKDVGKCVSSEQGQTVSVACCVNAAGGYIPPFFIFKRKRPSPLLLKNGPTGSKMAVSDKGYMNSLTFLKWLDHFVEFSKPTPEKPVLLILDNHSSHVSYEAVAHAKLKNIVMLSLPPHSSHKTQPLDKVFFKPLKGNYDQVADSWMSRNPGLVITTYEVAELFKMAYERTATIEKATSAFRATGIYPLDPGVFTDEDFIPSEVTDQPQEDDENNGPLLCFPDDLVTEMSAENPNILTPEHQIENSLEASASPLSVNCDPADEDHFENRHVICASPLFVNGDAVNGLSYHQPSDSLDESEYVPLPGPSNRSQMPLSLAIPPPFCGSSDESEYVPLPEPSSQPKTPPSVAISSPLGASTVQTPSPIEQSVEKHVSPADIVPLPKVSQRRKRTGRGLKSAVLTATPNKQILMEKQEKAKHLLEEKEKRKADRLKKQEEKADKRVKNPKDKGPKKPKARRVLFDSSDSESSVSVSSGESIWNESDEEKGDDTSWMVAPKREVKEYVAVKYNEKLFPGVVMAVSDTHATVSTMIQNGRLWKWPERSDQLDYDWDAVVSRIREPKKTSRTRNVYSVPELEYYFE